MPIENTSTHIAYFSMEIALEAKIPTYAGGLGILAGDTLRAAADVGLPVVAVTLIHRKGYFDQALDEEGNQSERPVEWRPEDFFERVDATTTITIENRPVQLSVWKYLVEGQEGNTVPVYLLDASSTQNTPWDRTLTDYLYGGDRHYRLCQEFILGKGGAQILRVLGYENIARYHMNEGHSAFLILDLLEETLAGRPLSSTSENDINAIREHCVFTTHTPVPAGHDRFSRAAVVQVLGEAYASALEAGGWFQNSELNMTFLALRGASYVNGVAMEHGEISQGMFPNYRISAITNGVHVPTWVSSPFADLYDRHLRDWRRDYLYLRYAKGIPLHEIQRAHGEAKLELIEFVRARSRVALLPNVMTIGFARRAATYKRADLLFADPDRLRWIARNVGPMQLVFAGKAHPQDEQGKAVIAKLMRTTKALDGEIRFVYLADYDMEMAQVLCSGVDLWLNTPRRPQEASGTSGMKAALNGVPSLSVLDGWWVEGHIEGVTGWAIGHGGDLPETEEVEEASLYDKLEQIVMPTFYGRPIAYAEVMRSAIAINGSFFTTRRMVRQYVTNAYFPHRKLKQVITGTEPTDAEC